MAKILVVEDDLVFGGAAVEALTQAGYTVYWAKSAQDAWLAIEVQTPDLVFLDIGLETADAGYEVLYGIKASATYKDIIVIMMSKLGDMAAIDKAIQLGAKDYLVKTNLKPQSLVDISATNLVGH